MLMILVDEPLEMFRDACLQAAVDGETVSLRAAATAARDDTNVQTIRRVLDAAAGSSYLPRLEAQHVNLWVPA